MRDLLSIDSLSKWLQQPEMCQAEGRIPELLVCHPGAGPQALTHPRLLSQAVSRELDGKKACQDMNRHPYGMLIHAR